jgi:hypothetical protein
MGVMKDNDPFVDNLKSLAQELDVPEAPRREEIWARIDEARRFRRRSVTARPAMAASRWWLPASLAASLALGLAIGRYTAGSPTPGSVESQLSQLENELPYEQAATRHLARTEALLSSFSVDAQQGRTSQVADWAQDLLIDTRLLMDSPASADPRLGLLLEDLELILAQLTNLTQRDPANELELIQAGIQQNDVLVRLRTATAEPMLIGT